MPMSVVGTKRTSASLRLMSDIGARADINISRYREWLLNLMIVERDIGRLANYTFDIGGAGDLLSLSLNVPPWEDLHELSPEELRLTNLVTSDMVAELGSPNSAVIELTLEPVQESLRKQRVAAETNPEPAKSTKRAKAKGPAGGMRAAATWPGRK